MELFDEEIIYLILFKTGRQSILRENILLRAITKQLYPNLVPESTITIRGRLGRRSIKLIDRETRVYKKEKFVR